VEKLSQEAYRTALESLPTGVYLVDRERRILLWSAGAEDITGYLRHEVLGRSCREDLLLHCDDTHACLCGGTACHLQQTMQDGRPRAADLVLLHKDGRRVPVSVSAVPLRDEQGAIIGAVECFHKRPVFPTADPLLRQLIQGAAVDVLTGLPDRDATEARVHDYLEGFATSAVPFGVVSISIDSADKIRHKDGCNALRAVLHATGQTLASVVGPNDMVGSWSEGRYLAVLTGCSESALLRAAGMMKRLVELTGIPWWGGRLTVQVSMGGAVVQTGDTARSLVARAEAALQSSLAQAESNIVVV
jgi:PAS domain S-box-containing protein/diguanylate cyclase (GGDEF)-like protein